MDELLSWYFYAFAAVIFAIEWIRPVYHRSRTVSVSMAHDCLWFVSDALFIVMLLPIYHNFLFRVYDSHLGFLKIDMSTWPVAGRIMIAILAADFIRWFHHLARHKVALFWHFHIVHHSQRELSLFTDGRVHPVERLIETGISFAPFLSLQTDVNLSAFVGWHTFACWHARFYHSNIKTDLGILRYVLVTPQSHRIHHSLRKEHRDKNFGAMFSIWDHLFGTQYRNYDEYPDTGLEDAAFPMENELGWWATMRIFLLQLMYPFQLAFRSVTEAAPAEGGNS